MTKALDNTHFHFGPPSNARRMCAMKGEVCTRINECKMNGYVCAPSCGIFAGRAKNTTPLDRETTAPLLPATLSCANDRAPRRVERHADRKDAAVPDAASPRRFR
jgi:hypothetical protein